jgi:hypothetical protein
MARHRDAMRERAQERRMTRGRVTSVIRLTVQQGKCHTFSQHSTPGAQMCPFPMDLIGWRR